MPRRRFLLALHAAQLLVDWSISQLVTRSIGPLIKASAGRVVGNAVTTLPILPKKPQKNAFLIGCIQVTMGNNQIPSVGLNGKEGDQKMMPFPECPVCGGEMIEKEVEKLLRGGIHTATIKVQAEVCLRCGERLYPQETVRLFEQIRTKLERQEVSEFQPLGQSFQVEQR